MTQETDFDALARHANAPGAAVEHLIRLAGAAFALPKWYFIARGEGLNVNPYVASNAGYEQGRQMIHCFTDTERLTRFARENSLMDADGTTQQLEVPAAEVVDYLEQFMKYDVYGIWFNSDTGSDGFSIPLRQLRPIQEHLARLSRESTNVPLSVEPPTRAANSESWGIARSADGAPDVRIKIFRTGNVAYGTVLRSFYTAIASLLEDYEGSGEYQKIFSFAPAAMQHLQEGFEQGSCFRFRSFQYTAPGALADATTIDSNILRHTRTGSTLLISFAMLQMPATSSTALYFGFEGPKSEVRKLEGALAPALEAAGFTETTAQ